MHAPVLRNYVAWIALTLPSLSFGACSSDEAPPPAAAAPTKAEDPSKAAELARADLPKEKGSSTTRPSIGSQGESKGAASSTEGVKSETSKEKENPAMALDAIAKMYSEYEQSISQEKAQLIYDALFQEVKRAAELSEIEDRRLQNLTARFIGHVNANPPVATEWHPKLSTLGDTLNNSKAAPFTAETFDLLLATSLAFQAAGNVGEALRLQRTLFAYMQESPRVIIDRDRELAFRRDYARLLLSGGFYAEAVAGGRSSLPIAQAAQDRGSYLVLLRAVHCLQRFFLSTRLRAWLLALEPGLVHVQLGQRL